MQGVAGPQGATGATGDTGPPGPFPATLPVGETLTGIYAERGTQQDMYAFVSFPYPLAAEPTVHLIGTTQAPPPQCPGTKNAPRAASGHLCIYQVSRNATSSFGPNGIGTHGRILYYRFPTSGTDQGVYGSWAVTG